MRDVLVVDYAYYPGCSLNGINWPYDRSLRHVFEALGANLKEIEDWNCCGASVYMAIDEMQTVALATRNLKLAEEQAQERVLVPCPSCLFILSKAQRSLAESPNTRARTREAMQAIGSRLPEKQVILVHPLKVIIEEIGLGKIQQIATRALRRMRLAPYYGCLLVRPWPLLEPDCFNPTSLDRLLAAAGAGVVEHPAKVTCCGGPLTGTIPQVGRSLVANLLREMKQRGADAIVTICPLCQFNLEAYQDEISREQEEDLRIPVLFFTQVLGIALGLPARDLGLKALLTPGARALAQWRAATS